MLGDSEGQMLGGDLLLHAIIHGNTQDALALLEEGEAHCNFANINQQTPLHVLTIYMSKTVVCCRQGTFNLCTNITQIWS